MCAGAAAARERAGDGRCGRREERFPVGPGARRGERNRGEAASVPRQPAADRLRGGARREKQGCQEPLSPAAGPRERRVAPASAGRGEGSGSVRADAASGGHGRPFPPSAQRLPRPAARAGSRPAELLSARASPSPLLLVGQRRVLASAMACLTGLDGRRDGSSSVRQPEPKLTCSIHCSRRGKAARRGSLYVFLLPHAATRCSYLVFST